LGIRGCGPKLVPPEHKGIVDFVITRDPKVPQAIHLVGMESPGLTGGAGDRGARLSVSLRGAGLTKAVCLVVVVAQHAPALQNDFHKTYSTMMRRNFPLAHPHVVGSILSGVKFGCGVLDDFPVDF